MPITQYSTTKINCICILVYTHTHVLNNGFKVPIKTFERKRKESNNETHKNNPQGFFLDA